MHFRPIVLDDCASTQAVKNHVSELVSLGMHARHFDLSTIVITQQFTSIVKPFRENISKLVIFYNPSKKDMQTIMDEFLNVEKDEIKNITQKLKNNKYARLEISLRHPRGGVRTMPACNAARRNLLHIINFSPRFVHSSAGCRCIHNATRSKHNF